MSLPLLILIPLTLIPTGFVLQDDSSGGGSRPTVDELRFFESEVRPLLTDHCLKCHGPEKQWAGLRLDSRDALLTGGDSGAAIVPGQPDTSLLIKAIRHEDENLQMPQDSKLSEESIAILVGWVTMGAPFPPDVPAAKRNRDPNHWAFQPPKDVHPPAVQDTAWVHTPVDQFILSKLEQSGLRPAPRADKLTLIRRLTFDLTGLPPTPEEIHAFLEAQDETATEKLIDRLLESPAYGERWGRHWLDVARYADSNGLDENIAHGNAWRYRDYVVNAINNDKPFDRFIREQLAGDLLPAASDDKRQESLIATGFLSIGPKVLAEVNMPKMRMDIVDEQIDTVGRVFMGMTFGCARCHDHKFDPIGTTDYYGLAGIFRSTRTMDTYTKVAKWHEHPLNLPEAASVQAQHVAIIDGKKQAIEALAAKATATLAGLIEQTAAKENAEDAFPEEIKKELARLRNELSELEKNAPELPSAMGVMEDDIADVAIHVRGNPSRLGDIVARHLPPVMSGPPVPTFPAQQSGRLELADWLVNDRHPLTSRVLVNRFWRWHFGEGLVRSTDNFGLLGDPPTHPELLDWLANALIREHWSLKAFHRIVLNSSTYQQSSHVSPEAMEIDPENQHWGRIPVRRLEAEAVRDAMLAVSGKLDQTMGGSLLKVKNRGYLFDHTSIDTTDYRSNRRSLYLPVIRNNVYELFQLLDFPDPAVPTGDRSITTVAPQALMMMNSELVMQAASDLADRILRESDNDTIGLQELYLLAYGRNPDAVEIQQNQQFLGEINMSLMTTETDDAKRRQQSWATLCQVIIGASEFIYVQ